MATVYYTPTHQGIYVNPVNPTYTEPSGLYLLNNDPEPFLSFLIRNRGKDDVFVKCPGFTDYLKQAYVITSPFDIEISFSKGLNTPEFIQPNAKTNPDLFRCYSTFLINRTLEQPKGSNPLLSLPPAYTFYSNESVMMEMLPPFMFKSASKFLNVPGTYDIGKWIRPIDFTVEINNPEENFIIKKGEPLFVVRFIAADGSRVELERIIEDRDLINVVKSIAATKNLAPKQGLAERYRSAEKYLKAYFKKIGILKEKKSKCPFGFGGK